MSPTDTKFAVKDVFEGAAYEFRVSAINLSGAGDPSLPCDTVIARDPMSKYNIKDKYFYSLETACTGIDDGLYDT